MVVVVVRHDCSGPARQQRCLCVNRPYPDILPGLWYATICLFSQEMQNKKRLELGGACSGFMAV